jgi:transposase-like protein
VGYKDRKQVASSLKQIYQSISEDEALLALDILFIRKDKYSKQACYTLKFHPEIKILLKLGCQQTTCITNKTRDAIKKKK